MYCSWQCLAGKALILSFMWMLPWHTVTEWVHSFIASTYPTNRGPLWKDSVPNTLQTLFRMICVNKYLLPEIHMRHWKITIVTACICWKCYTFIIHLLLVCSVIRMYNWLYTVVQFTKKAFIILLQKKNIFNRIHDLAPCTVPVECLAHLLIQWIWQWIQWKLDYYNYNASCGCP